MSSKISNRFYGIKASKAVTYVILFVFLLAFLVTLYFLMNSYGIDLLAFRDNSEKVGPFFITDQCSYLAGQLLHTINIPEECSLKCRSECSVLKKEYSSEEFVFGNNTCNSCKCACK
ncbi:MAG TPA: hypothetical protein VHA12_03590 [Candidatus Nanoarchaeia archaeon]|nr:hypothetical protein [Candidatus Nanoarchaeia archaeon]